jgi:SAM-dependent methyltransferase
MDEQQIEAFWDAHPCGDHIVGGLSGSFAGNYDEFFRNYDRWRYTQEGHIPALLDGLDVAGKQLLEVGLGQGADSEQLVRRGARWTGIDLTPAAVDRVKMRMQLRRLPIEDVRQGSVLDLPWPDDTFDVVFSHGVLHHVPDIRRAQSEIHRVLRPHGELVVMLYARRSLNFQLSIRVLRRLALLLLYPAYRFGLVKPDGIVGEHLANARANGLFRYLELEAFTHRSTDGPLNPYAKVYDLDDVRRDFPDFDVIRSYKAYLHAPPIPVGRLRGVNRLGTWFGWHLWVHLRPKSTTVAESRR